MKPFRNRVRNLERHLKFFLTENDKFHVGLLFEDYLKSPLLEIYGLPLRFPGERVITPNSIGSVTRANTKGKYVRAQPERKTSVTRHIEYTRRDGTYISYDREFHSYVKELLHQYNAGIYFATNRHGQQVVISCMLVNSKEELDSLKNTHMANIFCEIFGSFEVFNEELDPAIHFNTKFNELILPSGTLSNTDNLEELVAIGSRFTKNEEEKQAYHRRLKVLQEYNPDIRGKGPNGFYGYIVFGFTDLKLILLETMYAGNATYVFSADNFEKKIIKDKQTVLNNKLHMKRFIHGENWEQKIRTFLEKASSVNSQG